MSTSKKIKSIFTVIFYAYISIAFWIFLPYLNWQYANEHGFIEWIWFGEYVPTFHAVTWPYYVYERYYGNDNRTTSWPSMTQAENDRLRSILIDIKSKPLTQEQLKEYEDTLIEYDKRVGRKPTYNDAVTLTRIYEMAYTYRNEFGKSMLASIQHHKPIFTNEFDKAQKRLLKAGLVDKAIVDENTQMVIKAANQSIYTDQNGVGHYPPSKEHVLEIMTENKIFKSNIDALKELLYKMASRK